MKHKRLVKALENLGLEIENSRIRTDYFYCKNGVDVCEWYTSPYDEDAHCVCIRRTEDKHDSQRDYTAGSYYHTLKSVVETMGKTTLSAYR